MTIAPRQTPAPYGQRRLSSDRAAMTIGDNLRPWHDNPPATIQHNWNGRRTIFATIEHNWKCILKSRNRRMKRLSSGKSA
jgi:hypothetical protein